MCTPSRDRCTVVVSIHKPSLVLPLRVCGGRGQRARVVAATDEGHEPLGEPVGVGEVEEVAASNPRLDLLGAAVAALPRTDDPAADLVEAGLVFRRFAREHPALFALAVQRVLPSDALWQQFRDSANSALLTLRNRLDRLSQDDGLGGRSITEAAWQFHALCEGLAAAELRNRYPDSVSEQRW